MYLLLCSSGESVSCLFSMRCLCFFTALHGDGDWSVTYSSSNVCALRGAMVYLRSYVQYQPTTDNTLWFTKVSNKQLVDLEHNADYTGCVESSCREDRCTRSRCHGTCTLRIKDLRQSDSVATRLGSQQT